MALPELEIFENFLGDAHVVIDKPDAEPYELLQQSKSSNRGPGATLWLTYPDDGLQLDSVLKKIGEGLDAKDSPSSRAISLAVLAIIVETQGAAGHVEHANRILDGMRRAELLVSFVSPSPPPTIDIRADYGPLKAEPFDPGRHEYWAERGGARWPVAPRDLRGHAAFVSRIQGVNLLNIERAPGFDRLFKKWSAVSTYVIDPYFQAVADVLLERLSADTARRLSLVEAAGFAAVDLSTLSTWSFGIHLFTWSTSSTTSAGCWAIFRSPELVLNLPPAGTWQRAQQWLLDQFGIDSLAGQERPIDVAAQTYAGLMQDARAHDGEGRVREAFLYFVIGLDHLFGEDGKSVQTVADRTAMLTHRLRSKTFPEEVACVKRVYDVRSRLVHDGQPVTVDDLYEADALACGVLWAITRIAADGEVAAPGPWLALIDSLVHLFHGDPALVTDDRFAAVGAASAFATDSPPKLLSGARRR